MFLTKIRITNYLSVNGESELPIDPRVTVLLGANDHGKSNLLRSIEHLNFEHPISAEDENWDSKDARIDFSFRLTDAEASELRQLLAEASGKLEVLEDREALEEELVKEADDEPHPAPEPVITPPAPVILVPQMITPIATTPVPVSPVAAAASVTIKPSPTPPTSDEDFEEATREEIESDIEYLEEILRGSPDIVLYRNGIGAPLSMNGRSVESLHNKMQQSLSEMIPRVELFKAFSGELQDSVTADQIAEDDSEFLQGIFFYAGLDPLNSAKLFNHDDETDKRLEEASSALDAALRQRWAQGVDLDLHFQLKHRGSSIELLVEDPAVRKRKARMSKRSSGVTQFFRLSMVLHARRKKNPANSYIYVFDEPGVFLHPKGQKDLLSVFEQLAQDTQIVYATHSLFMLNQNFPERHRLITKSKASTVVDSKPYRANWKYAVDALGVILTANILFSPNILLVEGDSDPLYLYENLRLLNHLGETDGDANLFGIMSYGDLPNLRFLMQTFKAESSERLLAVLFDGDNQGKQYVKDVSSLSNRLDVDHLTLESNLAIEDYCLHPDLYLEAVHKTLEASFSAMDRKVPTDLEAQIKASWDDFVPRKKAPKEKKPEEQGVQSPDALGANATEEKSASNSGAWFTALSFRLLGNGSSKVALARNYVFLSREKAVGLTPDPKRLALAKSLVSQIIDILKLPSQRAKKQIKSASGAAE